MTVPDNENRTRPAATLYKGHTASVEVMTVAILSSLANLSEEAFADDFPF